MMSKKIFLCDDNLLILQALELILSMTDAIVVSESKSSLALDYIIKEKPDIFICDLQMPGLNGEDLIKQIRAYEKLDQMFILCVSASYNGRDIALNAGADHFLPKPFEIYELLSIVNKALVSGVG
ncbi:response regulator [Sphingobacterium sp. ML3W]|uniref:response regulator n=1 Tax=Sphingobacterium sp. ML3W TaxID=1538644 RepID=UPI00249C2A2D|nr:response regulator [Sphingobacterium sp. ML3W]WFA82067.1 response regulator [Sphingobacterium sp. ML3W]